MDELKEEAGSTVEEAEKIRCEDALFLLTENGEDVWCKSKGIICYKVLEGYCEDENPVTTIT